MVLFKGWSFAAVVCRALGVIIKYRNPQNEIETKLNNQYEIKSSSDSFRFVPLIMLKKGK